MVGKTISHYKVIEKIGQGGMGEVYRAEDTTLKREVAIKVLPEQFTKDPQRLARFEREAQLLASLNHPNIAAIHSFEHTDDVHFLVLELVPGDTLAESVDKGPLPVEEALEVCRQIAEGVEAAHEKGVIHRDLKPANVKVTPEGKVKILDFGLAKAFEGETPVTDISQSPTLTEEMTRAGVILGTAAYMSPEQARGKPVDKRADVFAFGCVLYELLTGKRAFEGDTITETIAAVLKSEPNWDLLPSTTPWRIRDLLRRYLQKDLADRLRDIGDARITIREALKEPTMASPDGVESAAQHYRRRWMATGGLILAGAAICGAFVWSLMRNGASTPAEKAAERLVIQLGPQQTIPSGSQGYLAISPDGKHVVYEASEGTETQLYLRSMDQFESRSIPGTEGGFGPFFSPNGEWVGFFAGGKLKKVSISGGALLTLCDALDGRGASWGSDGTIIFSPGATSGLLQISAAGGTPKVLTTPDREKGEGNHTWPAFLPDGKAVLFTVGRGGGWSNAQIAVLQLETEERRVLIEGGTQPRYVPTGHLVYVQAETLMAVPFDLARRELIGAPLPIVEGVRQGGGYTTRGAHFSFSTSGSLVYLPPVQQLDAEHTLVWVDREGATQPLAAPLRAYGHPRLSPDGRQLAVTIRGTTSDVWIYDIPLETLTRLTFEGSNARPNWTPDGKWVTFRSSRAGHNQVFWKPADGSGAAEQLTTSEYVNFPSSWSPDGQVLAFVELHLINLPDIWVLPLEGERKPQLFLRTPFNEMSPMFSPDGRWLAYHSNESGRFEIYVQPFPGPGGKRQISTEGGREPVWSRNGRELFYRIGDRMMAVDVMTEPSFTASTPRILFEGRYEKDPVRIINYDVTPDGQQFVMVKASEQAAQAQIHVVLNWFEELKRLVPTN